MATWQLQEAKNRFSALLNAALDGEPQTVTRRGVPAVVAGRLRYERGNYRLLSQFVGTGQVRRHFGPP